VRRSQALVTSHPLLTTWFLVLFLGSVFLLRASLGFALTGGLTFGFKGEDLLIMFVLLFFVKSVAEGFHTLVEARGVSFLLSQPVSPGDLILARVASSTISHAFLISIGSMLFVLFDSQSGFLVLSNAPPVAFIELVLVAPFAAVLGIGTSLEINAQTVRARMRSFIYTLPFGLVLVFVHATGFGVWQVAALLSATAFGSVAIFLRQGVLHEVTTPNLHVGARAISLPSQFFWRMNSHQRTILRYEWATFQRSRQIRVTVTAVIALLALSVAMRFELDTLITTTAKNNPLFATHLDLLSLLFVTYFGGMLLGGVPAIEGVILNRRSVWLMRSLPVSTFDVSTARARQIGRASCRERV